MNTADEFQNWKDNPYLLKMETTAFHRSKHFNISWKRNSNHHSFSSVVYLPFMNCVCFLYIYIFKSHVCFNTEWRVFSNKKGFSLWDSLFDFGYKMMMLLVSVGQQMEMGFYLILYFWETNFKYFCLLLDFEVVSNEHVLEKKTFTAI